MEKDDPQFTAAVETAVRKVIPNVSRVERYLSVPVLALSVLGAAGILGLAGWAGKIVWEDLLENRVQSAIDKHAKDPRSPTGALSLHVTNMSKKLDSTFKTQVDSATFKVLRFGCTPPKAPKKEGFPTCAPETTLKALEDQTILVVANPSTQEVRLDVSVREMGSTEDLRPLYLQIYAEPPPILASRGDSRRLISLKPSQVESKESGLVHDGRLRVVTPSGFAIQNTSIDLTASLKEWNLSGPIQLRIAPVVERQPGAPGATYDPAPGTELFLVRTITSTYHRISALEAALVK